MPWDMKDMSGSLFRNDRRENENQPTHNGTVMVDGNEYYISAWVRTAQTSGKKFFSLAFTPKQPPQEQHGSAPLVPTEPALNDDIPF